MVAVFIVVAIASLFLVSLSITGMVTVSDDPYTRPLCFSDSECPSDEVCCRFHNSESGVCHRITMCEEIRGLTNEPGLELVRLDQAGLIQESPSRDTYLAGLLLGIAIIAFLVYFSQKALAEKAKV